MTTITIKTHRKMSWWFKRLKVSMLHCFTAKQHPLDCRVTYLQVLATQDFVASQVSGTMLLIVATPIRN